MNLKVLIGKLNPVCKKALTSAAELAMQNSHFTVEVEHLLLYLLEDQKSDLNAILKQYALSTERLIRQLNKNIESFKTGNDRSPAFSQQLPDLIREAWTYTSLELALSQIGSAVMVKILLDKADLWVHLSESLHELYKISPDALSSKIGDFLNQSREFLSEKTELAEDQQNTQNQLAHVEKYSTDLTALAKEGKIDPVIGRDHEIYQSIQILLRKRQNNPLLTGEAGVGKTAVVEGLALAIATNQVPNALKDHRILSVDLGALKAGAGIKGELENRVKKIIKEVKQSAQSVILFIDEAHMIMGGTGDSADQGEVANLLKPELARGELRMIAATTWSEYKQSIEKDPAMTRRFQVIQIKEPDRDVSLQIIQSVASGFEKHHEVKIVSSAREAAIDLSTRYIKGRQLPDKAIAVLDTACARVAMMHNSEPPALTNLNSRIVYLEKMIESLNKEPELTKEKEKQIIEFEKELLTSNKRKKVLEEKYQKMTKLLTPFSEIMNQLDVSDKNQISKIRGEFSKIKKQAIDIQGEDDVIMHLSVDEQVISDVVSDWTGIPVGRLHSDQVELALNLDKKLKLSVIGQNEAIDTISKTIKTCSVGLADSVKPLGTFLLVGPSGVGKTETANCMADEYFGGVENMITINMSEYQEAHTVSSLKGAPPGYVGYGKGGVLTDAVKRNPSSLVLLDEIEKAHPDVWELFYQVFDKGFMEDGEGNSIDFTNCIIFLTSNVSSDLIYDFFFEQKERPNLKKLTQLIQSELEKVFKPAFIGRLSVVPYYPLSEDSIKSIVQLKIGKIIRRFEKQWGGKLKIQDSVISFISDKCVHSTTGARLIDNLLSNTLLPELSDEILSFLASGKEVQDVTVNLVKDKLQYKFSD